VAGYPAVVDRDGVSPELSSDIEELNRRRADIAVGWATVEAHNRRRRRSYGLVGTASVVGLTIAVTAAGLVPVYLSEHGMLAGGTLNWLVPVGMLGAMAVGAGLYIWWYVAAGRPRRTAAGPSGPPAVAEALTGAGREARRLRLARSAGPRLEYLRASSQATGWRPVIMAALITGPLIVGLGWFSVAMAPGPVPDDWAIWLLWPLPVALAGAFVLWGRRSPQGRRAIERGLDRLAAYLGGDLLPSLAGTVDWLNRYWATPSRLGEYHDGPLHCGAAGTALGYPVMVDVEPDGFSHEMVAYPPRVVIYVAAVPAPEPAAVPSGRAGQLRAAIGDAGFTVETDPDAGLAARAAPPTVKALRRNPAELGNLGPLIGNLAALAAAQGVAPAPVDLPARQSSGGHGASTP
jgi:hypothetical protein